VASTMRAVRVHGYGGPGVLRLDRVPVPDPGPGELRVAVAAAGVNPIDWKVRSGYLAEYLPHALPLTLGWDLAGRVDAVGPGVDGFAVGDRVMARMDGMRDGAYAQFAVVRADHATPTPPGLPDDAAAALPMAALTAWQALVDEAEVRPGQTVLIHGAAGGVGHLAVQLAAARGARVVATAAEDAHGFVRGLGAESVLDPRAARFEDRVRAADAVVDLVGSDVYHRSFGVLRPGGVVVSTVAFPDQAEAARHGVRAAFVDNGPNGVRLREIAAMAEVGALRPSIQQTFPLAEARRAHEVGEAGHLRGKLVLRVGR
jgi:NADPH:quinone reductase-like Zn-dependent oxidoreductase